jgi:hypothetical protein
MGTPISTTDFDWQKALGVAAPVLGRILGASVGGPLGALIPDAVRTLSRILLGKDDGTQSDVAQALQAGLTPETAVALMKANNEYALELQRLGLARVQIDADLDRAYLADRDSARRAHAGASEVFRLGLAVLIGYAITIGVLLIGCYALLSGGLATLDVAVVGLIFGLLGTILGASSGHATQVVSYYFGSSRGSSRKDDAMVEAVQKIGERAGAPRG